MKSNFNPKVSVIVNCLNGERYLKEALDSIYSQTFQDWEIIFWDNKSTDNSANITRSYDDRLCYFKADKQTTLGGGRLQAFHKAKGEFIAILDVDDIWLPDKLEKQLPLFKNADVGLTISDSMYFDNTGDQNRCFSLVRPYRRQVFDKLLENNFMSTETMIFRKSCLGQLDYTFDPDFTMVCDFDLTLRVAAICNVEYIDEVLSKWRMHEHSETSKRPLLFAKENEKLISKLKKNLPELYQRFQESFNKIEIVNNIQLGIDAWQHGLLAEARLYFSRFRKQHKITLLAYLATYFYPFRLPESWFYLIRKMKRLLKGAI
jgi:glycosyltransferase involved in cell wall biosynthesis